MSNQRKRKPKYLSTYDYITTNFSDLSNLEQNLIIRALELESISNAISSYKFNGKYSSRYVMDAIVERFPEYYSSARDWLSIETEE